MTEKTFRILKGGMIVTAIAAVVVLFAWVKGTKEAVKEPTLGSVNIVSDRNYQDAIGSVASPYTLNAFYASSTSVKLRIPGLSNVVIGGTYLPKSHNSKMYLLVERSLDYGASWIPYDVITPSTDRVSVWSNGYVTSSVGVPFLIPGSGTAASGTAIGFSFDTTLAADYIRVSVAEDTTSTAGTVNVQILSTNH